MQPVWHIPLTGPAERISSKLATALVMSGREYAGRERGGRIVKIIERSIVRGADPRRGMPILPPSIEWARRMGYA